MCGASVSCTASVIACVFCRERRIQERRLRIQERLQALREGEATGPIREAVQKQSDPGKQQALESVRKIMAVRSDTTAAVQSVPTAANAAENNRRLANEQRKQEMRTQMLAEAEQSARKNAAVAMHWADLFTIDVPQVRPPYTGHHLGSSGTVQRSFFAGTFHR